MGAGLSLQRLYPFITPIYTLYAPFEGTPKPHIPLHTPISADPALRVERRGSPLFHFLGHLGSLGSCCARNGFWCCHNIRPKLRRSLICDNRSSQCPYCVLFSRLGSLTTVLTWLRSRACAGMQGWALCACVQTGFTHHGSHLVAVACMCRDAGGSVSVGSCCTFTQCSGHHMQL